MPQHKLIRVLEYTFDTEEDLQTFYAGDYNAVPWNGEHSFGSSRKVASLTFRPDLTTFETPANLRDEVYQAVLQDTIYRAELVVVLDRESGTAQVVKDRTGAQHPTGGFRGLD